MTLLIARLEAAGAQTGAASPDVHQLWPAVSRLGLVEVVDVVLLAFILYQLLRLVRGTQATQLIVGMVLVALLGLASVALHLVMLTWLFQSATSVIVIALIVLFQPELRRMLDQLGRVPRLSRSLAPYDHEAIAAVVRGAERLSAHKVGALIAFEREVGLEDYVQSGFRVNARLSAELLETIFFPNSPLHDGAVIVRGTEIVAASCLLPLPEEASVRERMGCRHRAAIGLSLVSDAMILIVSEETGRISVVQNGIVVRDLDPDTLHRRVAASLDSAGPSNGHRQILGLKLPRPMHQLARRQPTALHPPR